MATSKEQPGKEQPRGEEVYSNEDRKLIISLLNEYSEKLLHVCEQIDKYQKRSRLFLLLLVGLTLSVVILNVIVTRAPSIDSGTALSLFPVFSVYILSFLFVINTFNDNNKRVELLKRDAKVLSAKLEKMIRVVSQAQEHVLSNFVSRIELDLRLSDAELALEHYSVVMKARV